MKIRIFTFLIYAYLRFVYATSKIIIDGNINVFKNTDDELFIAAFWHGDVLPIYPVLMNSGVAILTTVNKRGDYIAALIKKFGYYPLRAPDEADGGNHIHRIRDIVNETGKHLALTLDGPLGPYHIPKRFIIIMAKAAKRRIIPLRIRAKRKINIKSRWDNYLIPLPFSRITYSFGEPISVTGVNSQTVSDNITRFLDCENE